MLRPLRAAVPMVIFIALFCGLLIQQPRAARPVAPLIDFNEFVDLFNGRDLTGWEGDTKLWSVQDGMIVGKSPGISYNAFLATTKEYQDFELRLSFLLVGAVGNSGVQFRSARKDGSPQVIGYQADIGENYWGLLYDEARRDKFLGRKPGTAPLQAAKTEGWNEYVIRCEGDHVELTLNGVKTVDYREPDPSIPRSGIIAVQIHSGGPMEAQFKNIRIRILGR